MTPSPTRPPISVGLATDTERFLETDRMVWFQGLPVASTDERLLGLAEDQRFAADIEDADPTTYPGVYGVFPLTLNVPGPDGGLSQVPCAGLSWVGVHPDHRRQGVLSAMMRHHLEQVHEEADTHVSALHASEPAIYGRYGYGLASLELQVGLGRGSTLTAPELEEAATAVTTQFATVSDAGMPARLRDAHLRSGDLGAVVGDLGFYERVCFEPADQLRDKEPSRVLFARRDGEDVGFAVFRRTHKWENFRPAGELSVWLLVGDPVAELVLLRRLVDFDLMGSVSLSKVGVDDPLFLWAGGPRSTSDVGTYDSLWVRLVDLPGGPAGSDMGAAVRRRGRGGRRQRSLEPGLVADPRGRHRARRRGADLRRRGPEAAGPGPRRRIPRWRQPRRPAPCRPRRGTQHRCRLGAVASAAHPAGSRCRDGLLTVRVTKA